MSEMDLFQFQAGKETTFGTAVPQTVKFMELETLEIEPIVEGEAHKETRGTLDPSYNATLNKKGGTFNAAGIATYDDLPYWLDSLLGEATPTGTGPYAYVYAGAGAKPTPRMMTLTRGDENSVKSLVSALVQTLTLNVETNAPVGLEVAGFGHSVEDDALATLADRTVNPIHGNDVTLYIDAWAGTVGTTEFTDVAFALSLALDNARAEKPGLGAVTPKSWKQPKGDPTANQLMMRLEFDTMSIAFLDALLTGTDIPFRKLVRLEFALDANNTMNIDFAGFAAEAPVLNPDEDGVAVLEFVLSAMNDPTGMGGWLDWEVVNGVSTLA
jgi:hypothetical protein